MAEALECLPRALVPGTTKATIAKATAKAAIAKATVATKATIAEAIVAALLMELLVVICGVAGSYLPQEFSQLECTSSYQLPLYKRCNYKAFKQ
jgi:phosphoheptose isomerase